MKKIVEERKDIAFYIKLFPLRNNPAAQEKSKAIICEKSMALLEDAFAKKPLPKPTCETSAIDDNIKLSQRLGINSLPSIVLPNGKVLPGYKDARTLLQIIGN